MQAIGLARPGFGRIGAPAGLSLVPGGIWWDLTAVSGQTVYDNTGQYPATLGSTPGADTNDPRPAVYPEPLGLVFSGDDCAIGPVMPAGTLFADATHAFTVQIVVSLTSGYNIFAQAGSVSANRTFSIGTGGTPTIMVVIRGTSTSLSAVTPGVPTPITIAWDGTAAYAYVGAATRASAGVGVAAEETTQAIVLGARTASAPTGNFTGTLHAAGVYPGVSLSAQQIVQNLAFLRAKFASLGVILP